MHEIRTTLFAICAGTLICGMMWFDAPLYLGKILTLIGAAATLFFFIAGIFIDFDYHWFVWKHKQRSRQQAATAPCHSPTPHGGPTESGYRLFDGSVGSALDSSAANYGETLQGCRQTRVYRGECVIEVSGSREGLVSLPDFIHGETAGHAHSHSREWTVKHSVQGGRLEIEIIITEQSK